MDDAPDQTPEPLRRAVGALTGVPGVTLDSSLSFVPAEDAWALQLRLTSAESSEFVPKETNWVLLVDGSYPAGRIRIFPAQEQGLVHTFPHQDRNLTTSTDHATW